MYDTQVKVVTIPVRRWMDLYCAPDQFTESCKECPDYGKRWSCPPELPDIRELVKNHTTAELIGVKVLYDEETRQKALASPQEAERLQQACYGQAKKKLLEALLSLETLFPESVSLMAGRCEICEVCAREAGGKCRYPERMRYSYSGFGFRLGELAEKELGMPLLWQPKGLPAYHVAIASLIHS